MSVKDFFKKVVKSPQNQNNKRIKQKVRSLDKKLVLQVSNKSKWSIPTFKQLKHVGKFLNTSERKLIRIITTILIISTGFLGFYNYNERVITVPAEGGAYTEGLIGTPQFINPALAEANDVDKDLTNLIYDGLVKRGDDLSLEPDLAHRFEVSEDQKQYTFYLKDNILWHDNQKLTARDVVFTINLIKTPEYNSPLFYNFDGITVEQIDDLTVRFTLNEPYAPFLDLLTLGILPEHIWNNVPPSHFRLAEFNIKPIGSGPYMFKSLSKDKNGTIKAFTLEHFNQYHDGPAFIETLTFKFYPDFSTAVQALSQKHIEGISKLPRSSRSEIKEDKYQIKQLTLPQYTALFFNLSGDSVWKNENLRKVLAYSINKKELITDTLGINAIPVDHPIPEGYIGYSNDLPIYDLDISKAQELLEKEEYAFNSETNLWEKDEKPLEITITTVDQFDTVDVTYALQNAWQDFGIKVNVEIISAQEITQIVKQRSYQTLVYGEILGSDPDPYAFWHSTQRVDPGLNLSVYANKQIDELLEQGRQISFNEERAQKYIEFQKILAEEVPAIFLYTPLYNYLLDTKIENITIDAISEPADRFNQITQWYIKTKNTFK